ncbi:hypothetical protein SAMN05519105_3749 [Rhodobacter sp. 24-YEA-8]|nr:hypothetical protein SAMN05519105_3749 [Rhodobacter sp. 24-YEA-8]
MTGRDMLSRMLLATRETLLFAGSAPLIAVVTGISPGFITILRGGGTGYLLSRFIDLVMELPALILTLFLFLIALLPPATDRASLIRENKDGLLFEAIAALFPGAAISLLLLSTGVAAHYISHDLELATGLADRAVVLRSGTVEEEARPRATTLLRNRSMCETCWRRTGLFSFRTSACVLPDCW